MRDHDGKDNQRLRNREHRQEDAFSSEMESLNVEVRTKKPKTREQIFKEIQREIAQQSFPFSDMHFKPVPADLTKYGKMSKK